jgi:hypothetical protein
VSTPIHVALSDIRFHQTDLKPLPVIRQPSILLQYLPFFPMSVFTNALPHITLLAFSSSCQFVALLPSHIYLEFQKTHNICPFVHCQSLYAYVLDTGDHTLSLNFRKTILSCITSVVWSEAGRKWVCIGSHITTTFGKIAENHHTYRPLIEWAIIRFKQDFKTDDGPINYGSKQVVVFRNFPRYSCVTTANTHSFSTNFSTTILNHTNAVVHPI